MLAENTIKAISDIIANLWLKISNDTPFKKISLEHSRKYLMGLMSASILNTGGILLTGNIKPENSIIGIVMKKLDSIACCCV